MGFLIVMVLILVVMYVLMIRPQRQRQREQQLMIEGASAGDDVLTSGGIYGTITDVEGDDIVVEIADGLTVHMTRRAIAAVLPPEGEDEDDQDEVELEDGDDAIVEQEDVDEVEPRSDDVERADETAAESRELR